MNFNWVESAKKHGTGRRGLKFINGSKVKAGIDTKTGEQLYQLAITIPEKEMMDARLVVGDRVVVGFANDKERGLCIAIRRVDKGGFKICPGSKSKGASLKFGGETSRGRIQIVMRGDMPESFSAEHGGYEVVDGMLVSWSGKQ